MTVGQVKIWYDSSAGAYYMVTPYNKALIDALHQLVPSSDRSWDKDKKVWMLSEKVVLLVKDLAEKAFRCQATFISKQQAQSASAPPRTTSEMPLTKVIMEFFSLLPYDAARKAYQLAAVQLHPDRGGSLENMTRLNAAWGRVEKEHFKKE